MAQIILIVLLCLGIEVAVKARSVKSKSYKVEYKKLSKKVNLLEANLLAKISTLEARIENLEIDIDETDIYGGNGEDNDPDISDSSSENFSTPLELEKTFNKTKSRSEFATLDDVYKLLEDDIGSDYRNNFFAALDCYTIDLRENRVHNSSTTDVLPLNEPIVMKGEESAPETIELYTTPKPEIKINNGTTVTLESICYQKLGTTSKIHYNKFNQLSNAIINNILNAFNTMHLEVILNKMDWYLKATNKVVESQKTEFKEQLFWGLNGLEDDLELKFNRKIKSEFNKYDTAIQCFNQNFRSAKKGWKTGKVWKDVINGAIIMGPGSVNSVPHKDKLNFENEGSGSDEEEDCYRNLDKSVKSILAEYFLKSLKSDNFFARSARDHSRYRIFASRPLDYRKKFSPFILFSLFSHFSPLFPLLFPLLRTFSHIFIGF